MCWNATYLGADVDAMACCLICCCGCCGDIERAVDDDLIMAFAWFKGYLGVYVEDKNVLVIVNR